MVKFSAWLAGMARKLKPLGTEVVQELEAAWDKPQPDWARQRLTVLRLIAQHELNAEQIAAVQGITRKTVFNYLALVRAGGVARLLTRMHKGGKVPVVRGAVAEELVAKLGEGRFRRAKDAQAWIKKRTRKTLGLSRVYQVLGRLGARLKVPRKAHAKQDHAKTAAFKVELATRLDAVVGAEARAARPVRVWVLDEHRYGLLPVIRRMWGLKGVRILAPYATRYQWGYLHEAIEVDGANQVELLFTPCIDQEVHTLFLQQIGAADPTALHVVIQDQAGFHLPVDDPRVPANVRLLPLPPYSPELNPVERFGDLVKDAVSNRLFPSLTALERRIEAALLPWRNSPALVAQLIGQGWLFEQVNAGALT